jgi:hypothetical protein
MTKKQLGGFGTVAVFADGIVQYLATFIPAGF